MGVEVIILILLRKLSSSTLTKGSSRPFLQKDANLKDRTVFHLFCETRRRARVVAILAKQRRKSCLLNYTRICIEMLKQEVNLTCMTTPHEDATK